ncbi:MAG: plasma-membrane proton-efflux P-type ATPase [Candidatus Theseobacter exili]|nr:plasma-membrane proton-efflux P-type ATPase [Candidatus Theseobacter exili]
MEVQQIGSEEAKSKSSDELYKILSTSPDGLSDEEVKQRLEQCGPNALESKEESALLKFLQFFWGPIPWMIEVAAILSIIVKHWDDFIIIAVLLIFNAVIGFAEEHKAANALAALKKGLALKARALRGGKWQEIDASELVPGDIVRLRLGDIIPADVKLVEGAYISIDQAALTGESLPVSKKVGDVAYSGSVAKQGEMVAVVTSTGSQTFFGRTAKLVESAGAVSHFQKAVMRIGDFLIFVSVGLSVLLITVELIRHMPVLDLVQFVLILVIASIPVAMPAVLSVTMALGALSLSKQKAIVSRLQAIEEMAGIDILCSDKTGTLTKNQLALGDPVLFSANDAQECILAGALASKEENQDAIDLAVIGGLREKACLGHYQQTEFMPFDPIGKRTEGTVKDTQGVVIKFTKGAPQVVVDLCNLDDKDKERAEKTVIEMASKGFRTLGVAKSLEDGNWDFMGILPLYDPPRDDSVDTIEQAKKHGIQVKMVTGDNVAIAREISGQLGMGTHIQLASDIFKDNSDPGHLSAEDAMKIEKAEGFAQVFPEHKYGIIKALQDRGHLVAMTGDGVNDAPALKQADTGVAVSGATDAARAAAALVLTAPGLSVIIKAVETARQIFERMMSYTIYRIAMTIDIMFFVVLAMLVFKFKPLTAVMIILLALLDDIPIMTIAYDNTRIDPKPVKWDMHSVLTISTVLGILAVIQTFSLVALIYEWWMNNPQLQNWVKLDTPHIQTIAFLQLVAGGHLMLFVTRTKKFLLKPPFPAWPLFTAIIGTQILAALMCGFGWLVPALPWEMIGIVWIYNIIWMFFQDIVKIVVYRMINNRVKHKQKYLSIMNRPLHTHGSLHQG